MRVVASEVEVGEGGSQQGVGQWHSQVAVEGRRQKGSSGREGTVVGVEGTGQEGTGSEQEGTGSGQEGTGSEQEGTVAGGAAIGGGEPGVGPKSEGEVKRMGWEDIELNYPHTQAFCPRFCLSLD